VAATPAGQSDLSSAFERDLLCAEETVCPKKSAETLKVKTKKNLIKL
jgi:hypothetical protein